ncbi:hypothetical protein GLOIN_2v1472709 [Rhizophagus irregularis DAOM 181602=DAOM 197198]|nr:hypothetical protein GLOIN_2v1472709 [Rhizophagus irregularis DAOM 181602=DAOM 197198]
MKYEDFFGEMSLLASAEDYDLTKNDEENRGIGESLSLLKLYGLQIYDYTEMAVPYKELYVYREVQRFHLPTNRNNVILLLCRSVLNFLLFKEMLIQNFTNNEALFTNTDLKFEGDYTPRRYDVLPTLEEVRINNTSSQIWNRLVQRHSEFTFQPTKNAFLNTAYVVGVKRNCPTNQHIYL